MTDNQTPPDWVLIEAAERSNFAYSIGFIRNNYGTIERLRDEAQQYEECAIIDTAYLCDEAADALERLKGYARHTGICEGGTRCDCGLYALLREIGGC